MPQSSLYIDDVHRLNDVGTVVTHVVHGTTAEGFVAEWREINVLKAAGDRVSRCEMFDEEDLDAALASFEELHPRTGRLENVASQVSEQLLTCFAGRDWAAMAESLADEVCTEDRRRLVGSDLRVGHDAAIEGFRSAADLGIPHATSDTIAIRAERLVLSRVRYSLNDEEDGVNEVDVINVVEIDTDNRIAALVVFDLDEFDAAIAELEARYVAGEAGAHAHTWTVIAKSCASMSRQELPAISPAPCLLTTAGRQHLGPPTFPHISVPDGTLGKTSEPTSRLCTG